MKIFKYELQILQEQEINLPEGSTILSVKNQHEQLVLYARVNDEEEVPIKPVKIILRCTGFNADATMDCTFLDTVMFNDGNFVVHIFVKN